MGNIGLLLLIQVILIGLNAVFASAEIAILSANETKLGKLEEKGNKKAKRLKKLMKEPAKFLSTIQIAITLSGFLGSAFAAENFSDPLVTWLISLGVGVSRTTLDTVSVIVITLILSYFTLVFGELVPKRIAMKKSDQLALALSGLIGGISAFFKPVVWFLSLSTNGVLRLCGIDPNEEDEQVSEEDIRMMVEVGGKTGSIDKEEQVYIQNIFEFDDIAAGDIATHRTDVICLWMEDSDEEWEQTIHKYRYTLYPVCDGSADHIVGILDAKSYFRLKERTRETIMTQAVKSPYFAPDSLKADVLFRKMKERHQSLAVIIDEYGGMVGIVTMYDLLEELVGELGIGQSDESRVKTNIEKIDQDTWKITGNISLDEIEQATDISLEEYEFETFTGLVFDVIGKVLPEGEQDVMLEVAQFTVRVLMVNKHQIESALIYLTNAGQDELEEIGDAS